ncbi:gastrula zinc finger protein XlCGF17.1-like [Vanessa cardui]|uniref:gastrula zinc finger protein XlCGF17.1-like n=1 Tax=Vanessa cardui TaxID=171605 RepID=UPI001F13DABA|nr:gastrula zinc finger protein XlCGF17.1-like [Vanessa cardui]
MASSYFKLKILNRNRKLKGVSIGLDKEHVNEPNADLIKYKKSKCRVCLLDGSIFIFSKNSKELIESIKIFGGIEVSEEDNYPEYLCNSCYNLLQNAMLFRKKAQESYLVLTQQDKRKPVSVYSNEEESLKSDTIYKEIENKNTKSIKYKCEICNIVFLTWNELVLHNNSIQHRNVRIQCPICKGLLTTQLYKKHLARHQSATHLVCDVCGKMYRKDNLVRHLQLHNFDLPFRCKICPYRGRFPESLKIHMRTHTGQKPFSCNKCHLSFLTRSNLKRHLLTHNKQKPFNCNECSRGFYTKHDMAVHITSDHIGIKNYRCKSCGNKYGTRKALMRHELRVHKREKMAKGRMPLYLQPEYKI